MPENHQGIRLRAIVHADTAGAAMDLATSGKESMAAIASALAAETYGLDILRENIEDEDHNTTRFVIMAKEPIDPDPNDSIIVTSFGLSGPKCSCSAL